MKDTYTILGIEEKGKGEYQIAFRVEAADVPSFKAMVSGPATDTTEASLAKVAATAHEQLQYRREKIAAAAKERTEEENLKLKWDALRAGIEDLQGTEAAIEKPKPKKKRLAAPNTQTV